MPDKPTPLREALRDAFVAYATGMQEVVREAARHEDRVPLSLQADVFAAMDRVAFLIEQVPIVFEARESDPDPSIEQQISELPLPTRNAIIGPNDMRRRLGIKPEARESDG